MEYSYRMELTRVLEKGKRELEISANCYDKVNYARLAEIIQEMINELHTCLRQPE